MEGETISVGPWGSEEGTPFCHKSDGKLQKVVLGYEGGFKSLCDKYSTSSTTECMHSNELIKNQQEIVVEGPSNSNIVKNADFSQGIEHWRRNWDHCQAEVVSSPGGVGCHYNYAIVTRRSESWHTIEQDITREVYVGAIYDVSAHVSVKGGDGNKFQMTATIRIDNFDSSSFFLHVGSVYVTNLQWEKLKCSFSLNTVAKRVAFYVEGPCASVDLLIRHVSISPVHRRFVINLQNPDEYLTGITGYSRKLQEGLSEVISCLTFMSNLCTYGPYGTEQGTFFSFKTTDGEINGFHGTSENYYLKSIGFHVKPFGSTKPLVCEDRSLLVSSSNKSPFDLKKELMFSISDWHLDPGPWGGVNGKPFDDGFNDRITQILLTKTADFLSSIMIKYDCLGELIWSSRRGCFGTDHIVHRIKFDDPEEYLEQISGYWSSIDANEHNVAITSMTFFTNKQKYGPVGDEVGTFFSSPNAAGRIRGFFGRSGKYLTAIGVHMQYLHAFPKPVL